MAADESQRELLVAQEPVVQMLASTAALHVLDAEEATPAGTLGVVAAGARVLVHLGDAVDVPAELARLKKKLVKLESDLSRSEAKLASPAFVEKAKPEVVATERERLVAMQADREQLLSQRAALEAAG